MNSLLANAKPKDISKEKWMEMWNNSHYLLQPLADVIKGLVAELDKVKADDFACPNHYAKLAYQAGGKEKLKLILSLLPDSVDK